MVRGARLWVGNVLAKGFKNTMSVVVADADRELIGGGVAKLLRLSSGMNDRSGVNAYGHCQGDCSPDKYLYSSSHCLS